MPKNFKKMMLIGQNKKVLAKTLLVVEKGFKSCHPITSHSSSKFQNKCQTFPYNLF